jgi:phosphatidylglycerophosphate synthase
MTYVPSDRRPIQARGWPIWQRTAAALAAAGASANLISIVGMVCGLLAGLAFAATALPIVQGWGEAAWRGLFVAAAALVQLRLLANLLDGMVAVAAGTASPVGELYNEVPDRISDAAALIGAGYALGGCPTLGYVAACSALFTAYVRAAGKAAGAANDFRGPMAKQQRMFALTALALYLAATPVAWQTIGPEPGWGVMAVGLAAIALGSVLTALRRLGRIARQLRSSPP